MRTLAEIMPDLERSRALMKRYLDEAAQAIEAETSEIGIERTESAREKAILFLHGSGVTLADICGPRGTANICAKRRDLMRHLHAQGYSLREIGRAVNRNHASIIYNLPGGKGKQPCIKKAA